MLTLRRGASLKTSRDFTLAGRGLGPSQVTWVLLSAIVGGASTLGTVQLAYTHGLAAWIFTLGCGLACLVLGLFFSKPLRSEDVATVSEYIGAVYGRKVQVYTSFATSAGMFLHVVGQFLASLAILQAVFPVGNLAAVLISAVLVYAFVGMGGIGGSRLVGQVKFILLSAMLLTAAGIILGQGGLTLPWLGALPAEGRYFSLFAYGQARGAGDLLAMVVGVVSTQTYLQALFAARDVRAARQGAFLAAAIIPPIGLLGVLIGLHLRVFHPEVAHNTAGALPHFLYGHLPAPLASFFMAALFITVLGTAAGLVLGVTTNLWVDCLASLRNLPRRLSDLAMIRLLSGGVLLLSLLPVFVGLDTAILQWSFLSMGLRGAAIFLPLVLVVFWRRRAAAPLWRWLILILPPAYVAFSLFQGI